MTIQNFDWTYFWETANYVSWYEYLALICFGLAWRFSIKNSLKTRQIAGKSFPFLWLVISGACCGICHHLFVDLNFKILIYIVVLVGAVWDYRVCRRLRLEQGIKERKKAIVGQDDREWSYGSDADKAPKTKEHRHHKTSDGDEGRRHRHSDGVPRRSSEDTRRRRSKNERGGDVNCDGKDVQFDDINE